MSSRHLDYLVGGKGNQVGEKSHSNTGFTRSFPTHAFSVVSTHVFHILGSQGNILDSQPS